MYPVDLADVITHVVAQLGREATASKVDVVATADTAPTVGDAMLLERLVHNLVENGIRHNLAPGSGERWVRVTSRTVPGPGPGTDRVEVVVTNTGPDIPPYEVEGLFKPFRRLGEDRVVGTKGAGLGLSIVRSVAEAHSGTVRANPREGGGLTVVVSLPVDPG